MFYTEKKYVILRTVLGFKERNTMLSVCIQLGFISGSGILLDLAVKNLLKCKKGWWNQGILFLGCVIQLNMVIYFRDWINLIPTFFAFLTCIMVSCQGSFLKKLTIGLMVMSTVFAFNAVADNFFYIGRYAAWALRCLLAVLLYLATRRLRPQREYELSAALWKLMLLLTVTPVGMVLTVALLNQESYLSSPQEKLQALILMVLAGISLIGLLWAVTVLLRQQRLEQEKMAAQINQKYYEAMEQQNFEVRRLKHDMANHLQALSALKEEKREEYIQGLLDSPAFSHSLRCCGEPVINAVLSVKETRMEQMGISFQRKVDIPQELPFEKADICAVFGNALDNAIEACGKLAAKDREIHLETHMRKGLFVLEVRNPVLELPQKDGEVFLTGKKDQEHHGFGIRSIQEIVGRYGGGMEIETEDHIFRLFLYLPLEKKERQSEKRGGNIWITSN